jgi:hypothetical protein
MSKPIYKSFLIRPKDAWYQLSQEQQDKLFAKLGEALEKVGGKPVLYCDSRWSSEQWQWFGVEEFPDIAAVQKLSEIHSELNWHRYIDSFSVLGTEYEGS